MPLPKLPEKHIWGTPKVTIVKGDPTKGPSDVEAIVTLVIKHKTKWYAPCKRVRTTDVHLHQGTTEGERIKKILQKAEEMVFSYQLDSHGMTT